MNKRVIFLAGAAIVVAIFVLLLAVSPHPNAPGEVPQAQALVTYTNAITGQSANDTPRETGFSQIPGLPSGSFVNITGLDQVNTYMTSDEASALQTTIQNFFLARSGLGTVEGGVKNNSVSQPADQTIMFTIQTTRPQTSYNVTVTLDNTYHLIKDVTFKRA